MTNNVIRKQRLIDLRNKLNAELTRRKLANKTFTNSEIVKISNINEIRNGIDTIKPHTYTDTLTQNRTVVKDIHFSELENIISILSSQKGNEQETVSDCNGGCIGLCVSCDGTCYSSCTSQAAEDCEDYNVCDCGGGGDSD